ncbi:MAG: hypothetical protein ABEJ79_07405 [Halolamina sp.]
MSLSPSDPPVLCGMAVFVICALVITVVVVVPALGSVHPAVVSAPSADGDGRDDLPDAVYGLVTGVLVAVPTLLYVAAVTAVYEDADPTVDGAD